MALSTRLVLRNAPQACIQKRNRIGNLVEEQLHPFLQGQVRTRPGTKGRNEPPVWIKKGTGARGYSRRSNCSYCHGGNSSRNGLNTFHSPARTNTHRLVQSLRNGSRNFRTYAPNTSIFAEKNIRAHHVCHRCFTTKSSPLWNATQEAPNAKAYLNSGAIAGARDLVDVKKVLVIGSGGLAIGQAGEFDYSGKLFYILK